MGSGEKVGLGLIFLKRELEASLVKIDSLEKENEELKQEMSRLTAQINTLKAHDLERKSILWKKLHTSININHVDCGKIVEDQEPPLKPKLLVQSQEPAIDHKKKSTTTSCSDVNNININNNNIINVNYPPPAGASPPPPPPPLPAVGSSKRCSVRRVPGVLELYRSLMKREGLRLHKQSSSMINNYKQAMEGGAASSYCGDMIGEIENRSTYVSSVKSDVEKYGGVIEGVIRMVQSAALREIWEVEALVKWVDGELSCLVDEGAVLKHFPQWPERKADALREAAFTYRDFNNLQSLVLAFKLQDPPSLTQSLTKMQALQDRLESSISGVERTREATTRRYKDLQIPWQWLMDTGLVGKVKLSSLKLARECMQRIAKELECNQSSRDGDLLLQGVRFAFRVHQFAGGFDTETMHAFEQLKEVGTNCG